ncbi:MULTISPECIES: Pvc16 family protein [Burkholderiaceae]|uniref:Pvc16 family protein n=1 Tax=Burkholderiaceae TaxID=119060 RepID=UPI0009651DAB|nr:MULTISPECIES: Pvc16 family protein [Burkholderiaceae]MCG1040893.1 DUF4255 domain-containing protein [Mycetohabitans sp. B7]SIT64863.1 Protein of unknown function [Burkholderia sp. b14]
MATPPAIQSDTTLIELNTAIADALQPYLPSDVAIRFTLPNAGENPDIPTVSVFLYDIQEDLQLRTTQGRQYDPGSGQLLPGTAQMRCCYLITYWDSSHSSSSDAPDAGAASQAMVIMNYVLNGLLNNRLLPALPGAYTRVLPPSEGLNSLGNFWQSMGNKPRLCFSYAATVPIRLTDPQVKIAPVLSVSHQVEQYSGVDWRDQAAQALKAALVMALIQAHTSAWNAEDRAQLDKITLSCQPAERLITREAISVTPQHLLVTLSGMVTAANKVRIAQVIERWISSATPVATLAGYALSVDKVDNQLTTPEQ